MNQYLDLIGELTLFAWRVFRRALVPPYEWRMILMQLDEVGSNRCPW